ncbi:hypothetical protein CspeluHIS016_0900640 [Cutaneotrichosporon spelunceum]|uniref:Major facilitator superfamily (MFS) profile domain-containing protein n=1 Tax=Cutaneotrichosporon spelunceum TaxID=1672016 RepID=A0AAD3U0I5_9TREE|nr:hypothetical protein CspeluHIS016_0900640 [Cutaneotrichosporon spelunceum]
MNQNSPVQPADRSTTPSYQATRSEATSAGSTSQPAPSRSISRDLAFTSLESPSATDGLPPVSTDSRSTTPETQATPHTDLSDASESESGEYITMDDGSIQIRRRSSARRDSAARRPSQRSVSSPLTRFRCLSATQPVDDEAIDEDEKAEPSEVGHPRDRPEAEQSQFGEMVTELCRHVSVEAAAAPVALYTPRSRTGSVSTVRSARARRPSNRRPSTSRVTFPETVVEHDLARRSFKCDLPRIDSEKTLVRSSEDEEPTLAKTKSCDSGASCNNSVVHGDDAKFSDSDDAEVQARAEEDAAISAVVKTMSRLRKILLGSAMMLTVLISSMNGNAVILTLPSLAADLGVGQVEAQWVSSAYSLSYGCGLLFAGRMADIYGRKYLFLAGLTCTLVSSVVTGFMPNLLTICILRAISGLGLAIATPAGFGILGVTFREEPERTIAFSCFGLGNPVGASVGMLVGGAVAGASRQGWKHLYFVLAGLCVIPIALGVWAIPNEPKRPDHLPPVDKRVDWLGGFLVTAALCLFTFSITASGVAPAGWSTPYVPALLAVSVLLFAAFVFWERHVERNTTLPPVAKLSMFSRDSGKMSYILLTALFAFISIAGWVYLVSLFYQEYMKLTPLGNAIRSLPASLCGIFASVAVMFIVPRVRAPYVLMIGGFLSGVACLLFATVPANAPYWSGQFVAMLCLPFGADLTVGIGSILMSNLCEDDEQSVGGALFQTATQIASALGICMSSLVVSNVAAQKDSFLTGLQNAFGMCTAFAWIVIVIATCTSLRKMGLAKDVGNGRGVH